MIGDGNSVAKNSEVSLSKIDNSEIRMSESGSVKMRTNESDFGKNQL